MSENNSYQTLLPDCDCKSGGIIMYNNHPVCRWCRKPYAEGGCMSYLPEHFQPAPTPQVQEREGWEILSFKDTGDTEFNLIRGNGLYKSTGTGLSYSLDAVMRAVSKGGCSITKVLRNRDNQVFTVGGEDKFGGKILRFEISGNEMKVQVENYGGMLFLEELKSPVQPPIEETTTVKERIEISRLEKHDRFLGNKVDAYFYQFCANQPFNENKFPQIMCAIENVLNEDTVVVGSKCVCTIQVGMIIEHMTNEGWCKKGERVSVEWFDMDKDNVYTSDKQNWSTAGFLENIDTGKFKVIYYPQPLPKKTDTVVPDADGLKTIGERAFNDIKLVNPKGGIKEFVRMAAEYGYRDAMKSQNSLPEKTDTVVDNPYQYLIDENILLHKKLEEMQKLAQSFNPFTQPRPAVQKESPPISAFMDYKKKIDALSEKTDTVVEDEIAFYKNEFIKASNTLDEWFGKYKKLESEVDELKSQILFLEQTLEANQDKVYSKSEVDAMRERDFYSGRDRVGGLWNEQIKNWTYPTFHDYKNSLTPLPENKVEDKQPSLAEKLMSRYEPQPTAHVTWAVNKETFAIVETIHALDESYDWVIFSSKELAEKWVKENKKEVLFITDQADLLLEFLLENWLLKVEDNSTLKIIRDLLDKKKHINDQQETKV